MPSKFMSVSEAAAQLLKIIEERNEGITEEAGKMLEISCYPNSTLSVKENP